MTEYFERYIKVFDANCFTLDVRTEGESLEVMKNVYTELKEAFKTFFTSVLADVISEDMVDHEDSGIMFFIKENTNLCRITPYLDPESTNDIKMYINIMPFDEMTDTVRAYVGRDYSALCDVIYNVLSKYKVSTSYYDVEQDSDKAAA
jgi:hypothetical protein